MISLYNVCSILCYFIKVGIFFNHTFELQSSRAYVGAGGILHPLVVKEYSYSLSIDADIVLESGIYLVNGWLEVKNYPATLKDSFATLIVLNYNNVVFQILTILNSKEILYRLKDNESWKSWS